VQAPGDSGATAFAHVLLCAAAGTRTRRAHLQQLCRLVADGQLAVVLDSQRFVGLESVPDAVERLQAGASSGKVVVQLARELPAATGGRL
jgi:NADPH-dependent curcumin reductase CurA